MERNCATTLATGCSFLVEIVFHVLQIMQLSPRSPDIEQSFRGQLMEVRSVLARCMKRESVTHYQCVQCIGKNIIYDQPYVIFLSSKGSMFWNFTVSAFTVSVVCERYLKV